MKQLFCMMLCLFISTQHVLSQSNNYIPNITVATPQVASISKVSEIPVDIATGKINYNLPIFEVKEGNFTMPINLSYNYSGLLVDETPGYAGVGWTFNIGGAIMHIIKGLNDEEHLLDKSRIYKYFNKISPYNDENDPQSKADILQLYEKISDGSIDGRPDKYTVNIGNINCSFYLDKDDNPIFLKNENFKIIKNASLGFTLTDDKGINYVFNLPQVSQNASSSSEGFGYNSSFLITEINFPSTNNKIMFEYSASNFLYDLYNSFSSVNTIINYYNNWSTTTSRNENRTSINKLSKIVTNSYTIELQYDNNPTEPAVSVITKLEIKNKTGNSVKTYDFTYSPWSGRRRNLLSLNYNNQVMNTMEYDGNLYPTFSEIDLTKKDLWGYYNAAGSLPLFNAPPNPLDNPGIKPHFESTKLGSLKKITYATKGYSLIEYEQNNVFMNLSNYNLPYPSDSNVSTIHRATTTNNGVTQQTSFVVSTPATLNLYNKLSNETQISGWSDRLSEVLLYKQGEESTPIFYRSQLWTKDGNWMPTETSFTNQTTVNLTPGTYFLKAKSNAGSTAHIITTLQQSQQTFNQSVGGIRVKEVKNCDFNGSCITTAYNYLQSGHSTGILLQKPKFYSGSFFEDRTSCLSQYGTISTRKYYYSYNSIYPLSNFRGSPVLYKIVEQSDVNGLDNNGKTIYKYSGADGGGSGNPEHGEGFNIGQLEEKNIKSKSGELIQKQKNTYLNNIKRTDRRFTLGLECKPARLTYFTHALQGGGIGCSPLHPRPLSDFVTETFTHESENFFLEKEDNSNYFNGREVLQSTMNSYNADTGNLKTQISTNSQGQNLETKYYYPTDIEMINLPFVTNLIGKNMMGTPLKSQSWNSGTNISEQITVYDQSQETSNLLQPKDIYAAKLPNTLTNITSPPVGTLEKKITFNQYDDKGNILQYTSEAGAPITIIWGYNKTQPIAKIENATYNQISSFVANLQTLSDTGTEADLLLALSALRNDPALANAMVSTYTHIPLIGVSTITDPKGDRISYTYDTLGRLDFVKDKDGNILSENQYNYKQ